MNNTETNNSNNNIYNTILIIGGGRLLEFGEQAPPLILCPTYKIYFSK